MGRMPQSMRDDSGQLLFSVVVPTYNRPEHVGALLRALDAQTFPRQAFEVILVDDGGPTALDGIAAASCGGLQLRLVRQENRGCGPARQWGTELAGGVWLAFTDDDCRPEPHWLSRLAEPLRANPGCAVAGRTRNALANDLCAEASQIVVDFLSAWDGDGAGFRRFVPTSNVAFPAAEFRAAGGLDTTWSLSGGEDRDLCARWLGAGFRIYYRDSAEVLHRHHLTVRGFLRQHLSYGRGALRFHRRAGEGGVLRYASRRAAFFVRLLLSPFRQYGVIRASRLALLLAAAQLATAAGLVREAAGRADRPRSATRTAAMPAGGGRWSERERI